MDGLIRMERQKFPFTIENILSKYPNSIGDRRTCVTIGDALKEKAVSPMPQTETLHHTCVCCCYCSHCENIFRTDFIHEGKTWTVISAVNKCFESLLLTNHQIRFHPCSLSVWMASYDALKPVQAGRGSRRGKVGRSGAKTDKTSPHDFHRRAAGCAGGAVPTKPVSRCEHEGETGAAHSPERRESRGLV